MKEVRSKATAAARHGEKTLGGVAEALMVLEAQAKRLSEINKGLKAAEGRLGSMETVLKAILAKDAKRKPAQENNAPFPLLSSAVGLVVGVVLSGVFFWN